MSGGAPPQSTVGVRRFDDETWTVATRSAPVVFQLILALLLVSTWLLSRWAVVNDAADPSRTAVLGATGIAVVVSLVVAITLLRGPSPRARGLGLSAAACAAIVLIGAVPYAFWLL